MKIEDIKNIKECFIIAEFGMLHDGSFGNACKMVDVAKECGADAVKFQTHIAEAETLKDAPMPYFFKGESRWNYFKRTAFTKNQWMQLKEYCDKKEIEFMSSPFSIEAVDLLDLIGMYKYKIPSGEVTNLPMLEHVAKKNKPIILSSGMSSWKELDAAVKTIRNYNNQLTVLQCTSIYPTPLEKVGLNVMLAMKKRYFCPVGLSDQSLTNYACFAAVTLGASVVEKHVTLSKSCYGSDAKHSIEPDQFAEFVRGIRNIETILANPVDKDDLSGFVEMKKVFEKSIVSLVDISAGTVLTEDLIGIKKPGNGIPPEKYKQILGKRVKVDIKSCRLLLEADIE